MAFCARTVAAQIAEESDELSHVASVEAVDAVEDITEVTARCLHTRQQLCPLTAQRHTTPTH